MNMLRTDLALSTLALAPSFSAADVPSDPHDAKAREIFARVIAFKTSEGLGQVPAMAEYLAGEFRAAGFPAGDIRVVPLDDTASLVVRYRSDSVGKKPIALMAHMDVVTAKPES